MIKGIPFLFDKVGICWGFVNSKRPRNLDVFFSIQLGFFFSTLFIGRFILYGGRVYLTLHPPLCHAPANTEYRIQYTDDSCNAHAPILSSFLSRTNSGDIQTQSNIST